MTEKPWLLSFRWGTLPRQESACRHFRFHAAGTHEREHDKLVLAPLVFGHCVGATPGLIRARIDALANATPPVIWVGD